MKTHLLFMSAILLQLGPVPLPGAAPTTPEYPIRVAMQPQEVILGIYGGTDTITWTITNTTENLVELPKERWLLIERDDKAGESLWTPPAPYTPWVLQPKEEVTVIWRIRESLQVRLVGGGTANAAAVEPGSHVATVYFKLAGTEGFARATTEFNVARSVMGSILKWVLISVVVLFGLGLITARIVAAKL